jgi:addiction module HigA family antidote
MIGRPKNRPPTHPGEMLLEEFLKPLHLTQVELADLLEISFQRVNQIVNGKRGITPDTALRLARLLGTSPELWLGLQQDWDLWEAMHTEGAKAIQRVAPISRRGEPAGR